MPANKQTQTQNIAARLLATSAAIVISACGSDPKAPNEANFTRAIDAGLEATPAAAAICLRYVPTFPQEISDEYEFTAEQRKQYDAFVQAGLATERISPRTQRGYFGAPDKHFHMHQYALSSAGNQASTTTQSVFADINSMCYASYRVAKIVNFTEPGDVMGIHVSQVRWLPKIVSVADWAKSDKVTHALPEIPQTLTQLPAQEKTAVVQLTNSGWEIAR